LPTCSERLLAQPCRGTHISLTDRRHCSLKQQERNRSHHHRHHYLSYVVSSSPPSHPACEFYRGEGHCLASSGSRMSLCKEREAVRECPSLCILSHPPYSLAMVSGRRVAAGVEPDTARSAGRKEENSRRSGGNRRRTDSVCSEEAND
jgi:hypothetical protein